MGISSRLRRNTIAGSRGGEFVSSQASSEGARGGGGFLPRRGLLVDGALAAASFAALSQQHQYNAG